MAKKKSKSYSKEDFEKLKEKTYEVLKEGAKPTFTIITELKLLSNPMLVRDVLDELRMDNKIEQIDFIEGKKKFRRTIWRLK